MRKFPRGTRSKAVTKKYPDQGVGYGAEAEAQEAAGLNLTFDESG